MDSKIFLEKLISFDTPSNAPNEELIAWVADKLRNVGAEVRLLSSLREGKACLFARIGPSVSGGVVLAGHTDVVPVDGQTWHHNPLILTEREGLFYGRGVADMKGFISCVLSFVLSVNAKALKKPIYVALTFDEEVDLFGARELVEWMRTEDFRPDWLWLGEPTLMKVADTHKGMVLVETHIQGVPVHSSDPDAGFNALYLAADIIAWVRDRFQRYAANPHADSPFVPPYSTMNVGKISGGTTNNIVAEKAVVTWDYRPHPGEDVQAFFDAYKKYVDDKVSEARWSFPSVFIENRVVLNLAPFVATPNHPGVAFLCRCSGQEKAGTASFGTEASVYQSLGIPVVICGPGSIAQAHQPDEYVAADQLALCVSYLEMLGESLVA